MRSIIAVVFCLLWLFPSKVFGLECGSAPGNVSEVYPITVELFHTLPFLPSNVYTGRGRGFDGRHRQGAIEGFAVSVQSPPGERKKMGNGCLAVSGGVSQFYIEDLDGMSPKSSTNPGEKNTRYTTFMGVFWEPGLAWSFSENSTLLAAFLVGPVVTRYHDENGFLTEAETVQSGMKIGYARVVNREWSFVAGVRGVPLPPRPEQVVLLYSLGFRMGN